MNYKKDVVFAGRVSAEELGRLTGACLALAYVSFFEGFGIPLLEGMSCDVPVIASNVSSMPEVGADAALYVDPASVESIADALAKIDNDAELREALISSGRRRRNDFSWDKTAKLLWASIEKVVPV
ncbi:MAG TPA: glycosyltransferase [Acidobacteriota bacterium]|nr:glycosyltransferase [Acidobacteriota bacterium]